MNYSVNDLLLIMARLRDPEKGCPWDLQQDYKSILPYTLEEAYEVADAIDRKDYEELKSELGDLLFQIVFYSQLAKEESRFEFDDIVNAISHKLVQRHPHVFAESAFEAIADDDAGGMERQTGGSARRWEQLKTLERKQKQEQQSQSGEAGSLLDGIAKTLPAHVKSEKIQKRVAQVGFDWSNLEDVFDKIEEELGECREAIKESEHSDERLQEELGDLMFACINAVRYADLRVETVLRKANRKFEQRFRLLEKLAANNNTDLQQMDIVALEQLWQQAKQELVETNQE
jgi:ATP diphosphatase